MSDYFRCTNIGSGGGGSPITDYWFGNQTDFEAVQTKLPTTEYVVETDDGRPYRIYHGSTLIFPTAAEIGDYDFYIKDVDFYGEQNSVKFWQYDYTKDWRIDMKATIDTTTTNENIIFGSTNGSGSAGSFEFFFYQNANWRIYVVPTLSGDRNLGNLNGQDITIIHQNDMLSFYTRSGSTLTLIKEWAYVPTSASNNYFYLGRYKTTYGTGVHIDYFGFKILEQEATT